MQKMNNIVIKAALALFAAFLATGCIFEKIDRPEKLQSVLIQVNVSADNMQTKADPTVSETAINTIRIYAFYEGNLSGHFYRATASSEPIVMDLQLPLSGTHSVDFYVVANETQMTPANGTAALSENTTISELEDFKFQSFSSDGCLPMYYKGEQSINVDNLSDEKSTISGHEGHDYFVQQVEVALTRPVAKVSFYAATETGAAAGVYINEIIMPSEGTRQYGYLLPQTEAVLKEIPAKGSNDVVFISSPVAITGTTSSYADYMPVFENEYLFEVPVGVASWDGFDPYINNYVKFDVEYTGGEGRINMPPIERNTHYKIYASFSSEGSIRVDCIVADWEDTPNWTLDFAHPTYQNPVLKTGDHNNTGGEAVMYYTGTEEGAFSVDFKMTAPSGQKWTPTFEGLSTDYKIKVYDNRGEEVSVPVTASESLYTIKIIPMKPENINKTVKFGITYIPTWATAAEFLQINGSAGSLAWTTSGSNEDVIVVKQIERNN